MLEGGHASTYASRHARPPGRFGELPAAFQIVVERPRKASSQTSEIVRAVRERMARCHSGTADHAPAPSNPNDKPTSGRIF